MFQIRKDRVPLILREKRRDNESDIHSLPAGGISWLNTNLSVGRWKVTVLLDERYFQISWACLSETSKSLSWQEENKTESCQLANREVVFILKFLSVHALQRGKAEAQHSSPLNLFSCIIHIFHVCKCLLGAFVYKTQTTLSPLILSYFFQNKRFYLRVQPNIVVVCWTSTCGACNKCDCFCTWKKSGDAISIVSFPVCETDEIKQQLGNQIVGYMTATLNKSSLHMVTECSQSVGLI